MKRLLSIVALIATVIFAGCSEKETGAGISGGTPYSGDLLGSWKYSDDDESSKVTFYSDGSFIVEGECSDIDDGYWYIEKGLFYVQDNYLACKAVVAQDEEGSYDYVADDDVYIAYFYIVEMTSDYIEMKYLIDEYGDVDFDVAEEAIDSEYGGSVTSGDKYMKM